MAWAFATCAYADARPLLEAISAAAIRICGDFHTQGLSNTAWAFATLEVLHPPLRDAIASSALRTLQNFGAQELSNTAWAFAFSRSRERGLLSALRATCLERGRMEDQSRRLSARAPARRSAVDLAGQGGGPLAYEAPRVVLEAPGIAVIFKPAGWETDVYDVAKFGIPITPVARYYLLSSYLGQRFPIEEHPICHSSEDGFGFVHRLDQMSSGLILATTSFESHALLQWQMCSYNIDREYYVLCHGLVGPSAECGVLRLRGRILEGKGRMRSRSMYGERCRVDPRGKPAESDVTPAAHARLGPEEEAFSAVAISIVTGRQHQIRTHLQHLGHPSAYDGRYVMQAVVLRGARLADAARAPEVVAPPRPLPERHRAELALRGAYPW